jgi:acyl transferase domain-containing protein
MMRPARDAVLEALTEHYRPRFQFKTVKFVTVEDLQPTISRRSVVRILEELAEQLRTIRRPSPETSIVGWFRDRVLEAANRAKIQFRPIRVPWRRPPSRLSSLREWARLFAVHTGFSPSRSVVRQQRLRNGRDNDQRQQQQSSISRHPCSSAMEGTSFARRPILVDHRGLHRLRSHRPWNIRRPVSPPWALAFSWDYDINRAFDVRLIRLNYGDVDEGDEP